MNLQSFPQQYLCCENCGGPHETYQCQPMNQEYFYSHSPGFDQFQPPQFSDVYQTPPVASMEMLHAQTDLIESMQNFLKKYDHIPHNEKSIKLLLAEEKFLKIKQVVEEEQTQPEYLQELLQKEADETFFSDNLILRGIESDRDSGEDTISIDSLPLDDLMILPKYESFTFDDEPVMAEVNVFDEINTSEFSYLGIGENVVSDEEEDSFHLLHVQFLPFVTYTEDKSSKELAPSKALLTLDVFDPPHPPLMTFNVTKAFFGFSGFWKLHDSILWKDKAIPTISIDELQSSLHK
ncbi:hypothetical protein Tco_0439038 [Tanacetum coccineum]